MKKSDIILGVIFFLLLISFSKCTKTAESDRGGYAINLDSLEQKVNIKMSTLFKNPKTIILETTDEALIANSNKMCVVDDYIIILDKERAKRVFVFNKTGKFLHKIGNIGRGPGEYANLNDFTVDNEKREIYLLTDRNKVMKFRIKDGTLLNSYVIDNPNVFSRCIQYQNNKLYAEIQNFDNEENNYMVREIDPETGKQISAFLSSKENYLSDLPFLLSNPDMYLFKMGVKGGVRFFRPFMNTIFSLDNGKAIPFLTLRGKEFISSSDLNEMDNSFEFMQKLVQINKYFSIDFYLEFGPYIWLTLTGTGRQPLSFLYDKEAHSAQQVSFINDCAFKDTFGVYSEYFADSKGLYGLIDTNNLYRLIFVIKNNGILPDLDKAEELKNLKEDSNPVIFYYETK